LLNKLKSLKPTYCEETINAYFRKRLHDGCIDHGIASGFVFYDSLVKNYLENEKDIEKDSEGSFSKELSGDSCSIELKYRPEHLLLFRYIADAIIAHNVWRYNVRTQTEYAIYGLIKDDKMKARENKFSIQDNPLVFFLCLVDTIEPTKYFDCIPVGELLAGISLELFENSIRIEVSEELFKKISEMNQNGVSSKTVGSWFKEKIAYMDEWLEVNVDLNLAPRSCTISIEK